jgi:hypothetical protein
MKSNVLILTIMNFKWTKGLKLPSWGGAGCSPIEDGADQVGQCGKNLKYFRNFEYENDILKTWVINCKILVTFLLPVIWSCKSPPVTRNVVRLFRGLGIAMCWTSFVNAVYHNIILTYTLLYLYSVSTAYYGLNCVHLKNIWITKTQIYTNCSPRASMQAGHGVASSRA